MSEPVDKKTPPAAELKPEPREPWGSKFAKAALLAQHRSLDKDKDRRYGLARFIIARAIWIGLVLWGGPKILQTIECVFWVVKCHP